MLDKILNSFGSILKFFGVMIGLIVVSSIIWTFYALSGGSSSRHDKEPEVRSVAPQTQSNETAKPKDNGLASQLSLKVTNIQGHYFDMVSAYDKVNVDIEIENTSSKTLKGFLGDVVIKDAFGDVVKTVGYKSDEDLPPGKTTRKLSLELNIYMKDDQRLAALNKFTSEFHIEKILTE